MIGYTVGFSLLPSPLWGEGRVRGEMLRIAPYLQASAKRLRSEQTDAEQKIWMRLRSRQINGLKFRRQYVIGPYIVDFCCTERKIVV